MKNDIAALAAQLRWEIAELANKPRPVEYRTEREWAISFSATVREKEQIAERLEAVLAMASGAESERSNGIELSDGANH